MNMTELQDIGMIESKIETKLKKEGHELAKFMQGVVQNVHED